MTKGKKIMVIIIAVIVVVIAAAFFFLRGGGMSHVGINQAITNANDKEASMKLNDGKVLVLYFSETGNTQEFARLISDQIGGDLRRLERKEAYPSGRALYNEAKDEADNDKRPEYKDLDINMDNYDTVIVGYPIWWYKMPMVVYSFLDDYDLSGKTIIPFNTHEGSGDGGTYSVISSMEPNATVLEGLPIRGGEMSSDQTDKVLDWLKKLGFTE